ncbi:MAG: glutathione peroxidase [Chloroflexi bacterium]|nr:glutathione peroxidase [Chloroflexota bacterium]
MSNNISDIEVKTIQGQEKKLADYAGNVLLIVNVASECGLTPQYAGLEEVNALYRERGLRVLGFPSNDFGGQEPGTNAEICDFAVKRFGVTFDMFEKVQTKGAQQHPLYARLTGAFEPKEDVSWNFEKFLVNRQGEIIARFKPRVEPGSDEVINAIEKALA